MTTKPYLVVEWNDSVTDAIGWMCVYNTVNGYADGGIRMHKNVSKEEVVRLATTMAWKHEACKHNSSGGCKAGIKYDYKAPDAEEVLERFILAMLPYIDAGISLAGDLGVPYSTTLKIYAKHGREIPLTRTMRKDNSIVENMRVYSEMMKMPYDEFILNNCVTGYGVAWAADEAWSFKHEEKGRVFVQGFGSVGASAALKLSDMGYTVVGVSDALGVIECADGLDIRHLIAYRNKFGEMDRDNLKEGWSTRPNTEWLDVDCDILIPAALEDVLKAENANDVKAKLIVEGANIATTKEADEIFYSKGIELVTDFVANLGAVRFYHSIIFGNLEQTPEAVLKDIEDVCRGNTRKLYEYCEENPMYQRDAAWKVFQPETFDPFDI
ncbi:MAG: Glu/Leu/Phe/Val dehydrogenase [Firmicutes bacterium]|nr:Glu/Leu/Phe/Val dehydrogenase [Bacillota bacterium]